MSALLRRLGAVSTSSAPAISAVRAVLPPSIRRRWDLLALEQLAEHAARLDAENEELRRQLVIAEGSADFWHDNAMELAGENAGITVEGRLVAIEGGS